VVATVGFMSSHDYQEVSVGVGDLLILFSDGVLEARDNSGKIFGRGGIESAVARVRDQAPESVATEILEAAARHVA